MPDPKPTKSWTASLTVVLVSQFMISGSVSMVFPFMPKLVRSLGVDPSQEAFYAGLALALGGVPMFFTAPIWGVLADRHGRKSMLLRATFATGVSLFGFAFAPNVFLLMAARFMQGAFAGITSAAMAFVASISPREHMSRNMGLSQGSIMLGATLGPTIGGFLSDAVGFKATFVGSGIMILALALVIRSLVREEFHPPEKETRFNLRAAYGEAISVARAPGVLPLLVIVMFANAAPFMFYPALPTLLESLEGHTVSDAMVGITFSVLGIISGVASPLLGRLAGRLGLRRILIGACFWGALVYLPMLWVANTGQFYALWTAIGVARAGIVVASSALVALAVAKSQQGRAFGALQSSMALAVTVGPLTGGIAADTLGPRAAFGVAGLVFLALAVATIYMVPKALGQGPVPVPAESPAPAAGG